MEDLVGKWHIHLSNFPMWLKGDKTSPTFNYTIEKRGEIVQLLDEVTYIKRGKERRIIGSDRPVNREQTVFIWRGKGVLRPLKSRWRILYIDPSCQWAIIFFDKTLFTPEGYDVIARKKVVSSAIELEMKRKLNEIGVHVALSKIRQI